MGSLSESSPPPFPLVGFGTAEYPFGASPEIVRSSVSHAIRVGYRHFDTASCYESEQPLGDAISDALRLGLVMSRADLFVTSKLRPGDSHPHCVLPALQNSLKNLKLDYVDLYLIHCPVSLRVGAYEIPFNEEDLRPMDFKGVWEAMEECKELGLAKNIGVSNFSSKKLETLLSTAKIPPLVNQVEMNPLWQQKKLREFCGKKGIYITAYSPLGAKGSPWGSNQVMDCEVLKEIARAKGKSIAQICLRWVYEQGASVVVKSFNEDRMRQNLDIFDWSLTSKEFEKIAKIPQQKGYPAAELVSDHGPYKSLEELWDGEI